MIRACLRALGLVIVSVLVGAALIEGGLSVLLSHPQILRSSDANTGLRAALRNHYSKNDRAIVQLLPECAVHDAALGYLLKPGRCEFTNREFTTVLSINSAGLRDSEEDLIAPDVVITGDSHAMGWGVLKEQTFSDLLEKSVSVKVLNAAISSYGTARELLLLRTLDLSQTEVIVIAYSRNDFEENRQFLNEESFLETIRAERYRDLVKEHAATRAYYPAKHLREVSSAALKSLRSASTSRVQMPSSLVEAQTFLSVLDAFPDITAGRSIVVTALDTQDLQDATFSEALAFLAADPGRPKPWRELTIIEPSRSLGSEEYFVLDDHINGRGHAAIADRLRPVVESGLTPHYGAVSVVTGGLLIDGEHPPALATGGRVNQLLLGQGSYHLEVEIPSELANDRVRIIGTLDGRIVLDVAARPTRAISINVPIRVIGDRIDALALYLATSRGVGPIGIQSRAGSLKGVAAYQRTGDSISRSDDMKSWRMTGGSSGWVEWIHRFGSQSVIQGWALQPGGQPAVERVVAVADQRILGIADLVANRSDVNEASAAPQEISAGYLMIVDEALLSQAKSVDFFALTTDGRAVPLLVTDPLKAAWPALSKTRTELRPVPYDSAPLPAVSPTQTGSCDATLSDLLKLPVAVGGEISGFIDIVSVADRRITIQGWATDDIGRRPVAYLAMCAGNRLIELVRPNIDRQDVAAARKEPSFLHSGFVMSIPQEMAETGEAIRLIAIKSDGRYSPIGDAAAAISKQLPR